MQVAATLERGLVSGKDVHGCMKNWYLAGSSRIGKPAILKLCSLERAKQNAQPHLWCHLVFILRRSDHCMIGCTKRTSKSSKGQDVTILWLDHGRIISCKESFCKKNDKTAKSVAI